MGNDYYNLSVAPDTDPITLAEARLFLKIRAAVTTDDALITELITTATQDGESYTNRNFVTRTWQGFFTGVQLSNCEPTPFIELRRSPLIAVSEVAIMESGSYVATTDYKLKEKSSFSRLLFYNQLATADAETPYPLRVTFTAGYGNFAVVPEKIKTAIKEHVNFLYENRGDVQAEGKERIPGQVTALYKRFKIINTF